jgi:glycosyltransferase involved in cell wall biosynthesis
MKIGLVVLDIPATEGGGYTFQSDLLQALAEIPTKHEFILLGWGQALEVPGPGRRPYPYASIDAQPLDRIRSRLSNGLRRVQQLLPPTWSAWAAANPAPAIEITVRAHGIHLLWFLHPCILETETPYFFPVWDLQHRRQPWFPEVSREGQWEIREARYGRMIRRASTIISSGDVGRDEILRYYGVEPGNVLSLTYPTPTFALNSSAEGDGELRQKYQLPEKYLFYPAQFWPHKNHANLLLALRHLRKQLRLDLPLVLVGGDRGGLPHIEGMIRSCGLERNVQILGFVPQADLPGLYRQALMVVYVTLFGPENLPPLEAFALGCPVIASNVAGAREQYGDAALLVDGTDPITIAEAIKTVHDDRETRETLVARGRERALRWTARDFVEAVLARIDNLARVARCWTEV